MVKVGGKIRVTEDKYPPQCPRGAICTVTSASGDPFGDIFIGATVDGGNGAEWFFFKGEYEPLVVTEPEPEPEPDYAAKAAQYGICITVELVGGNVVIFDGRKCQAD